MKPLYLNTADSTRFFFGLLLLFCHVSLFFAKTSNNPPENPSPIFLSSGVLIYSEDISFNKSLSNSNIPKVNTDFTKEGNKLLIVIAKDKQYDYSNLNKEFKRAAARKKAIEIALVRKKVIQFEKQITNFKQDHINVSYPSNFFRTSFEKSWNYLFPTNGNQKTAAVFSSCANLDTESLQYLYIDKAIVYNSKIINHCFSIIHRLRPPPLLI